ncbi:transcription termination factor NusA [Desulfomonile tiedjei]|uniref:Transcription termination/antitermination protein NusA n=1 Tax=Desulfomonile tiedjei (strain ATCC 49306 / DSM 6799 / DCB-1) TaxID=706587 RepID=I4C9X5_DESTA|nr:transcription termination factor NusA [Desulfomonile tiedjei]AFM26366.1 NusA antitermination factor [Desulfomonile tiedjei DSM 6799]
MNLNRMIDQVAKEKGIPRDTLVEALEAALVSAARKKYGNRVELEAQFSDETGEVEVFLFKDVVEQVEDTTTEIDLDTARRELDPEAEIGDQLGVKMETESFGRIAAQTAKQVIIQKVKDAERENIYTEYKDRKNDIVTGIVQRFEKRNIVVNLGRAEAVLPFNEQIPTESYRQGDRIRALILDVRRTQKDPQIVLSRSNPAFLVKLFEQEVPEIAEGIVRIMCAAREPSQRAKIGVRSSDADVDPVGACVGMKGSRVQAVVQELRGEKIDIIPWHDDPAHFVCNALQPAEISKVIIDQATGTMEVIVADDQLSLAIGKKGQNVRLAAKLTGWKIDVRSESKEEKITGESFERLLAIDGMDEETATILFDNGYRNPEDIARATLAELTSFMGITQERGVALLQGALRYLANPPEELEADQSEIETESSDEEVEVSGQTETESVVELRAGHQEA